MWPEGPCHRLGAPGGGEERDRETGVSVQNPDRFRGLRGKLGPAHSSALRGSGCFLNKRCLSTHCVPDTVLTFRVS